MVELKFDDYVINKYTYLGMFKEGLARVQKKDNLWGYIDKNGNEVIPCQFVKVNDFSEGLAIVYINENQIKIINKKGEVLKESKYTEIRNFSEGLVAVKNSEGLWGYINKNFEEVMPCQFIMVSDFKEGYGIVKKSDSYSYINVNGELFGKYKWFSWFKDGIAYITSDKREFSCINKKFEKQYTIYMNPREIYYPSCGLIRWQNQNCKYGYLNEKLEPAIANMFDRARNFKEDVAIIEIKKVIGFVDKSGKITAFSKETQYTKINDFSEGLAAVENPQGLWGFIDKEGREVIPCKYFKVDDFNEGLCGVLDTNGELYYIDKLGNKKITFYIEYCSTLSLKDKEIYIKTKSRKKLLEKKLEILNQVKEERIKKVKEDIADISTDIMGDVYDLSKSRKRTN